ncbi:MAG TPA: hypothetical protein VH143_00625 [Kofleriaceae bacterium]|jgi:hypothetical protein|nr:hypothetical protein [Kofleriaceae bacterium]
MRAWFVLALAASACSSKPDCTSAVNGAIDRMIDDARGRMPPAAAANIARIQGAMKRVVIEACVDDQWSQLVVDCVAHASNQKALDACDKHLTKAQRESEHKRTDEVLKLATMPADMVPVDIGSAR